MENAREHARLAATAATAFLVMFVADGARAQVETTPQIAQQRQYTFNIPAQPLTDALASFGRQSGMQVTVDGEVARGVASPGVSGEMTPEQALTRLLAGTGITYRVTGNTAMLQRTAATTPGALQLDPVQVQGLYPVPSQALIDNIPPPYAGGQVATGGQLGLLGNRPVMDTPFNQTSYTAKKIQEQQAKSVRDVLADDPSVRAYFPDGSIGNDELRIRGFTVAGASTAYNGLYGILPYSSIMPEMAERVEVLKGPSAMLSGMAPQSTIGGTVNVVPKRAPDDPLTQVTAGYNSNAQFGGHVDAARRFGPDKEFGVRFNGVFRAGETAIWGNSDKRALLSLGLDYRGERFRLSFDGGYQYQYIGGMVPYLGLANNVPLPYAPDARKNWGQPWGYIDRKDLFGVVRGEFDITERVTAYAAFGMHDWRLGILSGGPIVTASNFSGAARATPGNISQYYQFLTAEAGVRALVDTGPIGHEFALSATTFEQVTGIATINGTPYNTNIYATNVIAKPNIPTGVANKTGSMTLNSLAIADTLSAVDKRIQLTVGARLQQVQSANFNVVTGAKTSEYDQSVISPSVALVFKPWANVSLYGNFIQGLQPGITVAAPFSNAGEVFPPYKSTQYEAGIKIDWGKLTTTASLFQITQPSVITNVATNTQVLAGEQRNQGLELNFFGEVAEGVRVLGGAMFLNAVLTKTQGGATNGWTAPFSPGAQFNFGGEWDLPFARGLTMTGRVTYTGTQYIDTTLPRRFLPEWTRFDIGARYVIDNANSFTGKPAVVRFAVENLLDNDYWASGGGVSTLSLGTPRTFRLSLTSDF
ncbi:MAG: TonB-dependent receptor [Reyranella sp.]|uniref:TonB-dependent receptor n=1 Tax=Reyranella sp. TaxID=1929291 RepID=UPI001226594C|nr:TonB-dependent receptor [Reyranella sp.]TAJ96142.1 MAG: TonB-dependent receptor [Reyranella sp.]